MDRLTLPEVNLHTEVQKRIQLEESHREHRQAFLNQAVKATKKSGQPRYRKFSDFFDYAKELRKLTGQPTEERFKNWKAYKARQRRRKS